MRSKEKKDLVIKFNPKQFERFAKHLTESLVENIEGVNSLQDMLNIPIKAFTAYFAWIMWDVEQASIKEGITEKEAREETMYLASKCIPLIFKVIPGLIDSFDNGECDCDVHKPKD